jgi:hypothetical protein
MKFTPALVSLVTASLFITLSCSMPVVDNAHVIPDLDTAFSFIHVGETTQDEVLSILGNPPLINRNVEGAGDHIYSWSLVQYLEDQHTARDSQFNPFSREDLEFENERVNLQLSYDLDYVVSGMSFLQPSSRVILTE